MSDTAERVKNIVVEHLGVDADKVVEARFTAITPGVISFVGAGCASSAGRVPFHSVTHNNNACGPLQGTARPPSR